MRFAADITELIGRTPLVRLNRVTVGLDATVLAKVEYFNPGGSSKDRIATRIIDRAERDGLLRPGGTIVEPTSGNTGVGLALVALQRGYRMIFVVPDKFAGDKVRTLQAYGAEVVVTPTGVPPEHPDSYYSVSDRLAREIPGAFKPDQFSNPNAPLSHYETTGPEIWGDTSGRVTHFVAGIGTGGTISGTGRYLHEVSGGRVRIVGADPDGSIYSGGPLHGYLVEGVGEDFTPANYDPSAVDEILRVSDVESFAMTRRLAAEEGLLVGGSSGMAVVAALRTAAELSAEAVVVVLLPTAGARISTASTTMPGSPRMTSTSPRSSATTPQGATHDHRVRIRQPRRPRRAGARRRDRAVIPPIHLSSTYAQDGIGGLRGGYEYGRSGNPTRTALQTQLAALEGGRHAFSFASGLAAEDALLRAVLRPGDEVLIGDDAYGGTYRLISRILGPWGVSVRVVDLSDLDAAAAALTARAPRILWVETPSNPLLRVSDIAGLARLGHEVGALVVVDNTFATPALQQPLAFGADVVVHSTTKYLGGHSDVVGGALVLDDDELAERIGFLQFAVGAVSGPLDAWLTTAGSRRSASGWSATARMRSRSPATSPPIRAWPRSTIRGSNRIRATRSRAGRCADSAASSRSSSPRARSRGASPSRRASSRSRSRSAVSSRS